MEEFLIIHLRDNYLLSPKKIECEKRVYVIFKIQACQIFRYIQLNLQLFKIDKFHN